MLFHYTLMYLYVISPQNRCETSLKWTGARKRSIFRSVWSFNQFCHIVWLISCHDQRRHYQYKQSSVSKLCISSCFSNYLYYIQFLKSYPIIHHDIQVRELGTFCNVYVCTWVDGSMLLIYYYYYILPSFLPSGFLWVGSVLFIFDVS